jgi:hypothetical protein
MNQDRQDRIKKEAVSKGQPFKFVDNQHLKKVESKIRKKKKLPRF